MGRVSVKLWLAIAAMLLFFALWVDVLLHWQAGSAPALLGMPLRVDLALAFLFTLPLAALLSLLVARRTGRNQRAIIAFADKLGEGDFSARV